ncbi:helix-turn-helix transcriptional regulator [[Clostridium] fimetarium]|uniref:Predicted DNA-binding transcriptional regulator YafY, contains an HTH and WYL domains n=1 Tax=[Clostridium] fimetarium TaxID=99656 RepID=A0A1I0RQB0_9FIRM|nr:YafY family protein [[Clostridium] fimetarium]SEW43488.1 Predicted DNA-binding transcriptional regulator YafY, contains an HTH and WYL domains [[Clostridium] fimetarium]
MQINRMFEIIYILIDKKTVTARELAQRFEVSGRTIYRDVEILSSAGIPIFMKKGKGGGISILDDFVLNKAVLTEEEKTDVLSSMKAVGAINFNATDSALKKLSSLFGENNSDWIEVDFSSWYNSKKESETFNDIKSAILSKKIINFTYSSGKSESTSREVEPLKLCFKGMSRYLYAYCRLRQDFRFFKLNRIKNIVITEKYFERIVKSPIFKDDNMFRDQYITLKLKLSSNMEFRIYDEFDNYTREPDGSFIIQTVYPVGEWLFAYIASFGSNCEVLEPLDIRNAVKEELKKTMNNYL